MSRLQLICRVGCNTDVCFKLVNWGGSRIIIIIKRTKLIHGRLDDLNYFSLLKKYKIPLRSVAKFFSFSPSRLQIYQNKKIFVLENNKPFTLLVSSFVCH